MFSIHILTFSSLQPIEQEMAGFAQGKQCNPRPKTQFSFCASLRLNYLCPPIIFLKRHPLI